ncbi:SEC-C motif-containing protein [Spirosomataceae bacterium TFI 002]|nr:SEC-C motif-containing protein [Spirosomataceae bacterium TFI 002]
MASKRNQLCECGSGKKYKKCCIDSPLSSSKREPKFSDYNKLDLIKTISSLSLVPDNSDKIIRLESIMNQILKQKDEGKERIEVETLKEICKSNYAFNAMEDPSENCFTEIITYYGGDYIIYPGITENGNYVLQRLLNTIFEIQAFTFSDEFKSQINEAALLCLGLSNQISEKLGSKRYEIYDAQGGLLFFPSEVKINQITKAIELSESEMEDFLSKYGISLETLHYFLFENSNQDTSDIFINNPIYKDESSYVIASPTTLSYALTNYIWEVSGKHENRAYLETSYKIYWWNEAQLKLQKMGFARFSLNKDKVDHNNTNGYYQFDSDKVAFIYIKDSKDDFKANLENLKLLHSDKKKYSDHQILEIEIIPVFGVETFTLQENINKNFKLHIPMPEFDILSILKLADAIDLWKFAQILHNKIANGFRIIPSSFLDLFKFYVDKDYSFYQNDNYSLDGLFGLISNAKEWRINSKTEPDIHTRIKEIDTYQVNIKVQRISSLESIYHQQNIETNLLLDSYFQPIWVSPQSIDFPKEAGEIVKGLANVIAFWIYQLEDIFFEPLKLLGDKPIQFEFNVSDWKDFIEPLPSLEAQELSHESFGPIVKDNLIILTIPIDFVKKAYSPQNEGERGLLKTIIFSLNTLLENSNFKKVENIETIINNIAPLGTKKKLNVYFPDDNLLKDPTNVRGYRLLQKHDVSILLDNLPTLLGLNCPKKDKELDRKEKQDLLNDITKVAFLPLLKDRINRLDNVDLLIKLIEFNEAIIFRRELLKFQIPSKIACGLQDEKSNKELIDILSDFDKTTISIRCLIEHIVAEQVSGHVSPSMTDIDELVAIMNQVMEWGALSDQIYFNIMDERIAVLPSGRIGTDKNLEEAFRHFQKIKSREGVADVIENFIYSFPKLNKNNGKEIPTGLDKAFLADYKISFTRLFEFMDTLFQIGLDQQMSYNKIEVSTLKSELLNNGFSISEIDNALAYLCLTKRGSVDQKPDGYEYYDIIPWRFNRRLSVLAKPLFKIETQKDKEDLLFWGNKQLVQCKRYLQSQIQSGRYRAIPKGKMEEILGKMANEKGELLVKDLLKTLEKDTKLVLKSEVKINSKSVFYAYKDLGDVDILIIDIANKLLLSLECKNIAATRNIKEVFDEFDKLYTGSKYIGKHLERHNWLKQNIDLLSAQYGIDFSGFTAQSAFITNEQLFTPILKGEKIEMPFISKYEIEKDGYSSILKHFLTKYSQQ